VLGQANVPECAVGILFLSFILFTVVVFLALAVTAGNLCSWLLENFKLQLITELLFNEIALSFRFYQP
jgi:hypothetical protein